MVEVREFRVEIPDEAVVDLRQRLSRTRWPDKETVSDWEQGVPLSYMRELADYWAHQYDMHRVAERLNAHPQFHAAIDGLGIYLLHIRSPHNGARPLIMTHGWPGSVIEFLKVIGPLTDPVRHGGAAEDAFHLVLPALPGYGFSDKPTTTGVGIERIGDAWCQLMSHLGYPRFYAQGGDWAALMLMALGSKRPEGLLGIHLNMALASPEALAAFGEPLPEEQRLGGVQDYMENEAGYSTQQSTRPQTLGYGLADSPVGQLAWILEKFYTWTDSSRSPEDAVSRDEILDDIMMYWLTNSATSSARLYWESFAKIASYDEVPIPSAYSRFPRELFRPSERWLRTRLTDLRYYHTVEKGGGHFAALEQPEIFVDEVRAGIRALQ